MFIGSEMGTVLDRPGGVDGIISGRVVKLRCVCSVSKVVTRDACFAPLLVEDDSPLAVARGGVRFQLRSGK